jgi:hypothetical protein
MTRHLHSAFGLVIASDLPLTELPSADGSPDVEIRLARLDDAPPTSDRTVILAEPNQVRGWIPTAGAFRVTGGREITLDPIAGADERALRLVLVGPLLGVVLSQRGHFVLHASTVAIAGSAVAFYGPSGRGKSTLTAALTASGHPLIADDMTVIGVIDGVHMVQPGFPRVKLWPDSASTLVQDAEALPLIHPDRTKRSLNVATQFHSGPLPLVRCYLIEDGETESVREMLPTEAILSLVSSTYQAHWMQDTGASGANLLQCGALVRSGIVRALRRRRSFDALPEVIRFIEADVRSRASPPVARA